MIVPDEDNKDVYTKLKASKVFSDFIKENKEIDSDEIYKLAGDIIDEIYGKLEYKNFRSNSHAAPWFLQRQNTVRELLKENGIEITYRPIKGREKLSFVEWFNRYEKT